MGFFSKKITSEKIVEVLKDSFFANYTLVSNKLRDLLQIEDFNRTQYTEVVLIFMVAIERATVSSLGKTEKTTDILNNFRYSISESFTNAEVKIAIKELFKTRYSEYEEVFDPQNKDLAIQIGQIFCNHFFDKEENGSNMQIMMFIGMTFISFLLETKKSLDKTLEYYEIV